MKPLPSRCGAGFAAVLAVAAAVSPVRAELRVCNLTLDLVNVAIGVATDEGFRTEGWWVVTANACAPVIRETLTNRYLYIYAADIYGNGVLSGGTTMCINQLKFDIRGLDNCWQRGFQQARFSEIDTKAADRWTVYLAAKQAPRIDGIAPGDDGSLAPPDHGSLDGDLPRSRAADFGTTEGDRPDAAAPRDAVGAEGDPPANGSGGMQIILTPVDE